MTRVAAWYDGLSSMQRRGIRDGLIVAGVIFNATVLLLWGPRLYWFIDATAWSNIDLGNLYAGMDQPGVVGAFRYAPVIGWLFAPAGALPWPALIALYLALNVLALVAMAGRKAIVLLLAFPPVLLELINGNISIFMALAVWAGFRWPGSWAFILLTKVTPGVGILWFAGRREWRSLAVALGATALIVAIGLAIAPQQWFDWFRLLTIASAGPASSGIPALLVRLPVAALIALWAGRTGRAWFVPMAVFIALPVVWIQGLAILTACFPLYWERARWRNAPAAAMRERPNAATRASEVTPA